MKVRKFRLKAANGLFYQIYLVVDAKHPIDRELDELLMKRIVKRFKKDEVGV